MSQFVVVQNKVVFIRCMPTFLQWPKRFQVMVRGSNFIIEDAESGPSIGFYTTRWVDAFDEDRAIQRAFRLVRSSWSERRYGLAPDLKLEVEEITEISFWNKRWRKTMGFVLFGEKE